MTSLPAPLAFSAAFLLTVQTPGQEIPLEVPFVSTPDEVVVEMLKLAEVGEEDVVYDLGCGDGRIVITAVKEFGARGVGIDKDPRRIAECRANAAAAHVNGRASFREDDFFEADIGEATVVSIYLLQMVNLKLRPKLLRELNPGSRVVSHNYDLWSWKPDKARNIGSHAIYCWTVPANVTGEWEGMPSDNFSAGKFVIRLRQTFQEIEGEVLDGESLLPLTEKNLVGDHLKFSFSETNGKSNAVHRFEGTIEGNSMTGYINRPGGGGERIPFKATRDPSTISEICLPEN